MSEQATPSAPATDESAAAQLETLQAAVRALIGFADELRYWQGRFQLHVETENKLQAQYAAAASAGPMQGVNAQLDLLAKLVVVPLRQLPGERVEAHGRIR